MTDAAVESARDYFPRGLDQPAGGYRFSMDSLLLASFARGAGPRVLDLGCGCGVVGLGILLDDPDVSVTGIESDPEMVACAKSNAVNLGFAGRYAALHSDVRRVREIRPIEPEVFDAVVCNPPFRVPGSGRMPEGARLGARFEAWAGIGDFTRAAAFGLKNKARFFAIFSAERLAALFEALASSGLESKRLRPVYGNAGDSAGTVLIEARKNGGPGLNVEPPLTLYDSGSLTGEALAFCPRLACNSGGA